MSIYEVDFAIHCHWFLVLLNLHLGVMCEFAISLFDYILVLMYVLGLLSLRISARDVHSGMCLLGFPCILRNIILEAK